MTLLTDRPIDTIVLRDVHVGQPKDKFGFISCGRQISIQDESIRDDSGHPLSILSSDQNQFDTSRDYLCAVNTKEEADNWVTEIRHAVSFGFEKMDRNTAYDDSSADNENDEEKVDEESYYKRLSKSTKPLQREKHKSGTVEDLVVEDESETSQHSNNADDEDTGKNPGDGIVSVTKVQNFVV